jgi:beta-lactamase superfamily II metal-dependent hydrolase
MVGKYKVIRRNITTVTLILFIIFVFTLNGCIDLKVLLQKNDGLTVTFIDVRHGDSILLSLKRGENILIDGGESNNKALDFIKLAGIKKIDKIIATNTHSEHVGGLTQIINSNIEVGSIWKSEDSTTAPDYLNFINAVEKKELKINTVNQKDNIPLGESSIIPLSLNEEKYLIWNRELYLPLDRIKKLINCEYEYLESEKKVTIKRDKDILEFWVDKNEMVYNGKKMTILYPPIIIQNTVLMQNTLLISIGQIVRTLGGYYKGPTVEAKITYKSEVITFNPQSMSSFIFFSGKYLLFDSLRFIAEAFGGSVSWNSKDETITIRIDENTIIMWVGKNQIYVNGKLLVLDFPPLYINKRLIIPINPIIEAIGGKVDIKVDSNTLKALIPYNADNYYLEVLNPPENLLNGRNNNSLVIKLKFGEVSFLFSSDAYKEAESSILKEGLDIGANILKLGSHGSSNSSSKTYLEAVKPEIAIYMANKSGYPNKDLMSRLKDMNIKVYGTDINGSIIVFTNGKTYSILTQR